VQGKYEIFPKWDAPPGGTHVTARR